MNRERVVTLQPLVRNAADALVEFIARVDAMCIGVQANFCVGAPWDRALIESVAINLRVVIETSWYQRRELRRD